MRRLAAKWDGRSRGGMTRPLSGRYDPAALEAECSGWVDMLERSDAGDVGGEEVDAVSVEVAAGTVVVLCGSWVGVAGEDLCVAQGHPRIKGVGDGGMA